MGQMGAARRVITRSRQREQKTWPHLVDNRLRPFVLRTLNSDKQMGHSSIIAEVSPLRLAWSGESVRSITSGPAAAVAGPEGAFDG
jgi:hypothetical protein